MKLLVSFLSMFAFLMAMPVSAAPFDSVQVIAKKNNLDRYNWCQKRFDKGWTWNKEEKKCVNPNPSSYNWCQKRFDHGYKWDKKAKTCRMPKKDKKSSLDLYGGEVVAVHGWKKRWRRRYYYRPRGEVIIDGPVVEGAAPLGFYGYRRRRGPVYGYRRGYRRGWNRGRAYWR